MRTILICIILAILTALSSNAADYYVSPTGNDGNNGLTPATAWKSIQNGDSQGLLNPGDIINVLPGLYSVTGNITFNTSGTASNPIVYRKLGKAPALFDAGGKGLIIFLLEGDYTVIKGLELTGCDDNAIHIKGNNCTITECYIHHCGKHGIRVEGRNTLTLKNIISYMTEDGIKSEGPGVDCRHWGNTIYDCNTNGIELKEKTTRCFNNIVASNNVGIRGAIENICGYNNVWGNPGGNYIGAADSAGGISKLPKFVDAASGRYDLQDLAFEINAGLDLGYPFNQTAPEIGAKEKYNTYFVGPEGNDSNDGRSLPTAWASIDNGDSLLFPGDTVYILPSIYHDSVVISDDGLIDDMIVYAGIRDSCLIDATGYFSAVRIKGNYVRWMGIDAANAMTTNLLLNGSRCRIENSRFYGGNALSVHLESGSNNSFVRCIIADNAASGLLLSVATTATRVTNCTFYNNGQYSILDQVGGNTFTNIIFEASGTSAITAPSSSAVTYSLFYNNTSNNIGGIVLGSGCLFQDPNLIEPDNGNFRLDYYSPAINAGINVGLPFSGSAPDMGAYETVTLYSIAIIPEYDSLFADSKYHFNLLAVDSLGNPADPGVISWSHTFPSGSIDTSGLFTPQLIGSGEIIAVSSINGICDTTPTMNVVPGSLHALEISPDRDTISADSTRQFTASGADLRSNPVNELGNLSWSVINNIGSIDASGLFNAGPAGTGFIHVVSDLGVSTTSDTIIVTPGEIVDIKIIPDENTIVWSDSYQYSASGYDGDLSFVRDLTDSVVWGESGGGTISAGGLFTGLNLGDWDIFATYEGAIKDTASVTVISNISLSYIKIELSDGTPLGDTIMTTDIDTTRLYCRGYDSGDNLLGDLAVQWSITGVDSIGSVIPATGTSTILRLSRLGTGKIAAQYSPGLVDTSGLITSQAGQPVKMVVLPHAAAISADSTIQFEIEIYDADDNIAEYGLIPIWRVLGNIGSISIDGLFTPVTAGIGFITASGGGLADTTGPVMVTPGEPDHIVVVPDSVIVSADSTKQFTAVGYDIKGNLCPAGNIIWSLTQPIGSIDSDGLFDAVVAGTSKVTATSDLGLADTSKYLEVIAGTLTQLTVLPDSVSISADNQIQFSASGLDSEGNNANIGSLDWQVIGNIGEINSLGLFTPTEIGSCRVAATSSIGGISDTNKIIIISAGDLSQIVIMPDSALLKIGDSLQFTAAGYDALYNPADPGSLAWGVTGNIGIIDTGGFFRATSSGAGRITAYSSTYGISDTSGTVIIEALNMTTIPLGNRMTYPGQSHAPILAFRIDNYFGDDRQITGITLHDVTRGSGTPTQKLSNIDSVALYYDIDNDSILTLSDSLIMSGLYNTAGITMNFPPLSIKAGTGRTILVGIRANLYPHDGDSLDICLRPADDILTPDGITVQGPDTVNSYGYNIIDGMTSNQISFIPSGVVTINPGNTIYNVLTFDLPRNGYAADTLQIMSIINQGTATDYDLDSLLLYKDNGDNIWGGAGSEIRLCHLTFIGDRWIRSGLSIPLTQPTNRFYIGARLEDFPTSGSTLALCIPKNGLEMASNNDGPIDAMMPPCDTIAIETFEAISVSAVNLPSRNLIPGDSTGPLLGLKFVNSYADTVQVDSLHFKLYAYDTNGATQAQLDSQIDSVALYLNLDGLTQIISDYDSLLDVVEIVNGEAFFHLNKLAIADRGGVINLTVAAWLNAHNCKNNNRINFGIDTAPEIFTALSREISGAFPVKNTADFIINTFQASSIDITPIPGKTLFAGQVNQPIFNFRLPGNGYASDLLRNIRFRVSGSFDGSTDLLKMKLWSDAADDGFGLNDVLLGEIKPQGNDWILSGLSYPIPSGGAGLIVTLDVRSGEFKGGTVRLTLPVEGAVYASGTTGPDNIEVFNPDYHLIFPSDQIIAFPIPAVSSTVHPDSRKNRFMDLALFNGYVEQSQSLRSITLTNASLTAQGASFADSELGQVSLYYDSDNNGTFSGDSLLTSGHFANGVLHLTGFDIALPAESLLYFFIVADFPDIMTDSDSLVIQISQASDLVFAEPARVSGNFPLKNGGYLIVDGSVAEQYDMPPIAAPTLSPGDTSITLMAFRPALNGGLFETLDSLTIVNKADADNSDISSLELWLDLNDDNIRQDADSMIGAFVFSGGGWNMGGINVVFDNTAPTLFAVGDISSTARPGTEFQGRIPINGCRYASDNDGPIDKPLTESAVFKISNSGLRITVNPLNETYSVGQTINIGVSVTNLLTVAMDNVIGKIVGISDSSLVTFVGGVTGPISLAPGEAGEFSFVFTADAVGEVYWQLQAEETILGDTSAVVRSDQVKLQNPPNNVSVQLVNSVPTAVIRGQTNVFPLSIKCPHPDSVSSAASLRLESLRLRTESSGIPLPANQIFSRMVLTSGYTNLTILEDLPGQSEVTLAFNEPVVIPAGQERLISLLVDIDEAAVPDEFVISITDATALPLLDNNTAQPVMFDSMVNFPLKTVSCRIDDPSQQMVVSDSSLLRSTLNYGQDDVDVLLLRLRHPGTAGSSQIQLTAVSIGFTDELMQVVNASEIFRNIRLVRRQTVIAELNGAEIDTSEVEIRLASPLTLSPGDLDSMTIRVDIKSVTELTGFSAIISDSTAFVVRDLSSGLPLGTAGDTAYILATETVFPITTGRADLKQPAGLPQICVAEVLPPSIVGGRDSLALLDLSLSYPAGSEYASLLLEGIHFTIGDTTGMILDPRELFDKIGFSINAGPAIYDDFIHLINGSAYLGLGGGITFDPGDSISLQLIGDVEIASPYDHFMVILESQNVITFRDLNDPAHYPDFLADEGCQLGFPFSTDVTSIYLPAGRPVILISEMPTQLTFAGGTDVSIWKAGLSYASEVSQGDVGFSSLNGRVYRRTHSGIEVLPSDKIFDAVYLLFNDEVVAIDTVLEGDSVRLHLPAPYTISRGDNLEIGIRCDIDSSAENGNCFIRFDDSSFVNIIDLNLATAIIPVIDAISYPISTADLSLMSTDLEHSFTNYPNPFIPSERPTIIGFVLDEDAYVDIEIFSITGDAVREVVMNSYRAAGSYNSDTWTGDNDSGLDVLPGTYFCRITARYNSGRTESFRRKIAVIR
ncbi:MAG: hypothetical protein CVT49_00390 [candidate division Zixibacteria bacterium HGW-Zixibacteria-1]|nr:MAG: hypothetical protein CVT49_00390 [candidate division Zixibacteria bacterium HGW-Zixibacteria-1]